MDVKEIEELMLRVDLHDDSDEQWDAISKLDGCYGEIIKTLLRENAALKKRVEELTIRAEGWEKTARTYAENTDQMERRLIESEKRVEELTMRAEGWEKTAQTYAENVDHMEKRLIECEQRAEKAEARVKELTEYIEEWQIVTHANQVDKLEADLHRLVEAVELWLRGENPMDDDVDYWKNVLDSIKGV